MEEREFLSILGPLTPLVAATLLAVTNSAVVSYLKRPLEQKFPGVDLWWFLYVSFVTGLLIGWFAEINLFEGVVEEEILGRILTAALIGGGSNLIYKVFQKQNGS